MLKARNLLCVSLHALTKEKSENVKEDGEPGNVTHTVANMLFQCDAIVHSVCDIGIFRMVSKEIRCYCGTLSQKRILLDNVDVSVLVYCSFHKIKTATLNYLIFL